MTARFEVMAVAQNFNAVMIASPGVPADCRILPSEPTYYLYLGDHKPHGQAWNPEHFNEIRIDTARRHFSNLFASHRFPGPAFTDLEQATAWRAQERAKLCLPEPAEARPPRRRWRGR